MTGSAVVARIEEAVALLGIACRDLDVDVVDAAEVARLHGLLVRGERLAALARVRLARRVVEAPESAGEPCGPAGWIATQTGVTLAEARRTLGVSVDLPDRPHLDVALGAGVVSTRQVEVIAEGVAAVPEAEAELVGLAADGRADLADLRRRSRGLVAAADPDPDATRARHHRRRAMRTWHDADGQWHAHLNAPADTGARVMAAIKEASDAAFAAGRAAGRQEGGDACALDGLVATLTRAGGGGRRDGRGRERQVIGVVDVEALRRGSLEAGDRCELAGVGPVSLSVMRELLGDAAVAVLFRKGTVDLAVAHLGREPTAFQRTALHARGYRCGVEGCGATRNLEIDHVAEWATTRRTVLADLEWLCPGHHRAKTAGQLRLTGPPGDRTPIPVASSADRSGRRGTRPSPVLTAAPSGVPRSPPP